MSLGNTMKGFIFKKPAQAQVGEENPYLNARRSWNDMMKSVIALGQGGILFGITGALIALAAVGGIIHIGSQSKFVPYIVEVDKRHSRQHSRSACSRLACGQLHCRFSGGYARREAAT